LSFEEAASGHEAAASLAAFGLAVVDRALIAAVAGFVMRLCSIEHRSAEMKPKRKAISSGQAMRKPWRCSMICTYCAASISEVCVPLSSQA
jgi:hypothetical protein